MRNTPETPSLAPDTTDNVASTCYLGFNRFDEVSMLESNLKMLQEEFKRQKEEEEARRREEDEKRRKEEEDRLENGAIEMTVEDSNPFNETSEESNPFFSSPSERQPVRSQNYQS